MNFKAILFTFISLVWIDSGFAQNPELLKKLYSNQSAIERIETLHELCKGYTSYESDSFIKYINWGILISKSYPQKNLKFRYFKVYYLDDINQYEAEEKLVDSILAYCEHNKGNEWVHCKILLEKGGLQFHKGDFNAALASEYKGIQIAEKTNDTGLIMDSYLSIGWLFMESNKYNDAIKWFNQAIGLIQTKERQRKITNLYLNAASCYNNIGNSSKALELVNLGLMNARSLNKWYAIANGLMIRSDIYINTKQYDLAEKDLDEALIYRAKTKDTIYMASDMAQYALYLASVNRTDKGISIAKEGLKLIEKFHFLDKELYLYRALEKNYGAAKQYKELSEVREKIIELNDSIQKKNYLTEIANAQAKYDVVKKQLVINNQNLKLKVRQLYILGLIGFLVLLVPLLIYWLRRIRRKLKLKLTQEIEIERKRISNDLHDGVGAYASSIYNGIGNLKYDFKSEKITNLQSTALELIEKLNQTVWVLDSDTISVSDLFDKYKNWFLKIVHHFEGIEYEFFEDIQLNKTLRPQDSLDLLNMMQEITNNALKHSGCTAIHCSIVSNSEHLKILFNDNGKGFDMQLVGYGNGLNNLKNRASRLGAVLSIHSDSNGSVIELTTPN